MIQQKKEQLINLYKQLEKTKDQCTELDTKTTVLRSHEDVLSREISRRQSELKAFSK